MDVLDHLTEEHRKVELLIAQLKGTDPGDQRDRLVDDLIAALSTHMAVEERFLYPIVAEVGEDEMEHEGENEHDLAREGLAKLDALRKEPGFKAALDMVEAGIGHHVKDEEEEVFPTLREKAASRIAALDPDELEAEVDDDTTDLTELSKDELYAKAQEADVPGRSSMTKDELAEAVSQASGA